MNKLKEIRLSLGLTQSGFGELMFGIPLRSIQNWENNTRECPKYLIKLIEYRALKFKEDV